ncbi:ABC transporter ATP-binding protein [Idiomarina loihiensis]|uniref:ABC-type multidrug transport system, ATPase and permease components n=1 Tax=Idiomarina loihiensis (strain ATCC BAA-735 / DSM 15497 / L2-TR) TaxID=283942 RepID=Q5R092_IDILO|nr:ABC transporter ATP-binding protein [Idiomarina loihiensis]AAV81381.1 ABC-type multidrug transport system, ATPase and permease components [Idiomarina loihiensis L2TR]AGM35408.1 multidrug ABC transporter ATPase and permease [Idiomarina loihiensis GSL 199]
MFKRLKALFKLLTPEQRKRLIGLQFLVVLMAFAEVAGVAAIGPFMALVGDISLLQGEGKLAQLYTVSGFENPEDFLFWLGIAVLIALSGAAAVSMFTTWRLSLYAAQVGAEISTRLYKHYMQQSWLFHASGSSSQLTNRIAQEAGRVTNVVIQPLMQMNAKGVLALVMATAIFIFNPTVALAGLLIFGLAYVALYKTVRKQLGKNGRAISEANQQRFKLMNEGFGGIKDTLLLGRQAEFNERFEKSSHKLGRAQGVTRGLAQVPRYAMELIAFGAVIFLVLYLLSAYDGNLGNILPVLSVYALAGFKLLPAFQQMYTSLAQVKGNIASFDSIEEDLTASQEIEDIKPASSAGKLSPKKLIKLDNISFGYPDKEEKALVEFTLDIPVNQVIGLVGASGSGKSTAIDVLLGLIEPQSGSLIVDGEEIKGGKKRAWQNNVGFVPQAIFLADSSIRENIAFGIPPEEIDESRVTSAVKMAHLDELLKRLPEGLSTRVGERGIQLSGGQRQRIGIARALYDDAEVLVLDEATSALDGITEKLVMDAIHDFSGKKTIIMIAHRLTTVKQCDSIYILENGRVLDKGHYDDLVSRNKTFQEMAHHS